MKFAISIVLDKRKYSRVKDREHTNDAKENINEPYAEATWPFDYLSTKWGEV